MVLQGIGHWGNQPEPKRADHVCLLENQAKENIKCLPTSRKIRKAANHGGKVSGYHMDAPREISYTACYNCF